MSKIRLLGLLLICIGVFVNFYFRNDGSDFFSGALIASGLVFLITGRIGKKKTS